MSPVHSLSAPSSRIRRSRVLPTTVSLFAECPDDHSPKPGIADRLTGDREAVFVTCDRTGGSSSGCPTADCPPPSSATDESQTRSNGWTRDAAAAPHERANARLVGIARLAASSPPALTRRKSEERPEYFVLPVKSILNRCDSKRVPFEWTINPYRGCEFACKYCYARYTHEYMELDGGEFEKKIFVKKDAALLLPGEVSRKYSYASERSGGTEAEHKSDRARYRCAEAHRGSVGPGDRYYDYDSAAAIGALAGASSAPAGFAAGCGETVARGRAGGWSFGVSADTRNHGPRRRFGSSCGCGAGGWSTMVFLRSALPHAVEYRRRASERVALIRQTYGFRSRPWVEKKHTTPCAQLPLAWDAAAVAQQVERMQSRATG